MYLKNLDIPFSCITITYSELLLVGSFKNLRFKARFDEILRNTQAEATNFFPVERPRVAPR